MLMNAGAWISAPVSSFTGFETLVAVLPLTAGSQYSTCRTTWLGNVTPIGLLLNAINWQSIPSLTNPAPSPTCAAVSSYCS